MSWINNAWTVGIATGIASGLLVTWLARFFLSKKDDREYQQKLNGANREVIYAVRQCIPEGPIPARAVIEALAHSTARRYALPLTDLYGPEEIIEELVKEVMDSSFLSAGKKAEYCDQLAAVNAIRLHEDTTGDGSDTAVRLQQAKDIHEAYLKRRRQFNQTLSTMLGLGAALVSTLGAWQETITWRQKPTLPLSPLQIFILTTLGMALFAIAIFFYQDRTRKRKVQKSINKNNESDDE